MSRLSDLIGAVIDEARSVGPDVVPHDLVPTVRDKLTPEDRDILVDEALALRIKEATMRGRAEIRSRAAQAQGELPFNLKRSYPIDIEGRRIKETRELTRLEVRRIIEIRRKSIADDRAALAELERAYEVGEPIWAKHPDLLFGRVLDIAVENFGLAA